MRISCPAGFEQRSHKDFQKTENFRVHYFQYSTNFPCFPYPLAYVLADGSSSALESLKQVLTANVSANAQFDEFKREVFKKKFSSIRS